MLQCISESFLHHVDHTSTTCQKFLALLVFTHEVPENSEIRFLAPRLQLRESYLRWKYRPHSKKPLPPFASAHSGVLGGAVERGCLFGSLGKSCGESMNAGFHRRAQRLWSAGCPAELIVSVAEAIHMGARGDARDSQQQERGGGPRGGVAAVPYVHMQIMCAAALRGTWLPAAGMVLAVRHLINVRCSCGRGPAHYGDSCISV